jgi:mRNA-degrading endonuclease YafQ of YafQ-DinJ toxin-antitoxin module
MQMIAFSMSNVSLNFAPFHVNGAFGCHIQGDWILIYFQVTGSKLVFWFAL